MDNSSLSIPTQELAVSPASSSGTFQSISGGSSETLYVSPTVSPPSSARHSPVLTSPSNRRNAANERTPLLGSERDALEASGGAERTAQCSMSLVFDRNVESPPARASGCTVLRDAWRKVKPVFFFLLVLTFSVIFSLKQEKSETSMLLCVCNHSRQYIPFSSNKSVKVVTVTVSGPFLDEESGKRSSMTAEKSLPPYIMVEITEDGTVMKANKTLWLNPNSSKKEAQVSPVSKSFQLEPSGNSSGLVFFANTTECIAMAFSFSEQPLSRNNQVVIALVILTGVYVLIIFELVHRATAAMLGSLAALATLTMMNMRPELTTVLTWIQWETLSLLFGMMVLVGIFARTGFFDVVALQAYKLSRGHTWRLITLLCVCTGVISALLDNVTTILLLTPVTIRLCEVLNLNPTYVLIAEVLFSNIGGAATAIGDPPNVIIVSHKDISTQIDFATFTSHLCPGIILCMIVAYLLLRLLYWKIHLSNPDAPVVEELKRQAEIWRRTAERMPIMSSEEKTVKLLLLHKTMDIENDIRNMRRRLSGEEAFRQNLHDLENKCVITDRPLLIKSSVVILLVIVLFFIHSFVRGLYLEIGWIAIMGAIALILLADIYKIEELMEQVEWTTLIFFAALFILMKALEELGLMEYLGDQTEKAIQNVESEHRLMVALIAITWISALASSFVDNIPFTTAMIPVILKLHQPSTSLPLQPLVWALALGACLGGNGTLIGASANVVCAGLAEQQGYPITFNKFFRVGFPIMLITTTTAMGYLLVCHCVFGWGNAT